MADAVERLTKKELEEKEDRAREVIEKTDVFTLATIYQLLHAQSGMNIIKATKIRADYWRRVKPEEKSGS